MAGNVARDQKNQSALRDAGWNVVTIWECETAKPLLVGDKLKRSLRKIVSYVAKDLPEQIALAAETPGSYRLAMSNKRGNSGKVAMKVRRIVK